MSDWTLVSSISMHHSCTLLYQRADGLLGMLRKSGGRKRDRVRFFVWALPDSAPEYATEAEARQALASPPQGRSVAPQGGAR
jgi:hypothetical protein